MNLNQLEAFVNVAREGSFTRAARKGYLSQPTITSHVQALEKSLGVKLLERTRREVLLTAAGKALYRYAQNILDLCQAAGDAVLEAQNRIEGQVEIAASTVPGQYLLPRAMALFRQKYPGVTFQARQLNSRRVVQEVLDFRAVLGLVGFKVEEEMLDYRIIAGDEIVLITPLEERYRNWPAQVNLKAVLEEPFVFRHDDSGTMMVVAEALKKMQLAADKIKVAALLDSTECVKQAVKEGLGVSLVSRLAAADYVKLGYLRSITLTDPSFCRHFFLVRHRERFLAPPAERFCSFLEKYYLQHNSANCG